ncbi:MAG: UDP-N-acetylmuramoyl-L-alanyl-D-glutamate--2,6-diaminopimelate ligase [Gammaproteobacteria bacterium]
MTSGPVPDVQVSGLADNSRDVRPGGLFLAAKGLQRHGLEFAAQAQAAGAAAIAYEPGAAALAPPADAVLVPDLGRRRGQIASRFYEHPSRIMKVCGVTGTNGKTTTVHLVSRASRLLNLHCGHMGTLGVGLTDPLTPSALTTPDVLTVHKRLAWLHEQGAQRVAMEVSSHALDQGRVDAVQFDTAVFTNLSRDHLDYHPSLDDYARTKQQLFTWPRLRHAVLNVDDPVVAAVASVLGPAVKLTAVGADAHRHARAEHWLRPTDIDARASGIEVCFESSAGRARLSSPLLGGFNATNLLQALAVLLAWEVPLDDAVAALGSVASPAGRMETSTAPGAPLMVVDYAHTPDALASSVAALRAHCAGELYCVFGCGGDRDRGKRVLMAQAAQAADHIIVTDDNPRHEDPDRIVADTVAGFAADTRYDVIRDRALAVATAAQRGTANDIVLVAGKGHEGYQLVGSARLAMSDHDLVQQALEART